MLTTKKISASILYFFILLSGFAALSWEVIWQIKATLALGLSAWGTAITLIVTMSGMSLGSIFMGRALRENSSVQAIRLYGLLELTIGTAGLFFLLAFSLLEKLDAWAYAWMPHSISLVYIVGMILVCGLPTLCMGATLPIFGLIAKKFEVSVSKLYSINTFGAAAGILFVALFLIPYLGVTHTVWIIAGTNIFIGCIAWLFYKDGWIVISPQTVQREESTSSLKLFIVFVTGFATFTLEIAWFRALLAIYPNTTDVFAILLACMLLALAMAANKVRRLKHKKKLLGTQLCIAGILILLWTPLIERLGNLITFYKYAAFKMSLSNNASLFSTSSSLLSPETYLATDTAIGFYIQGFLLLFLWAYFIIVPSMRFLGVAFPWIIDDEPSSHGIGKLYAVNTLAAVVGSIGAAWFLLPTIGFAKTAWIAGIFVVVAGLLVIPQERRHLWLPVSVVALIFAILFETGIGKTHVQGFYSTDSQGHPSKLLRFFETPEATIAAVEYKDGARGLLINSTLASAESGRATKPSAHIQTLGVHYMTWMGHLPMLLHPDPKKALVICFGTGQTANAVRKEHPEKLDIVDINSKVFKLGRYFKSNENVLNDSKVKAIVMDGRAYLRRTQEHYDVITLEPMPPGSMGVNALYSKEFYDLARKRLSANGVIAQWLPFQGIAPHFAASIAKTFISVFPNAILWMDVESRTGILLGSKDNSIPLGSRWPGFQRAFVPRNLSNQDIPNYIALNSRELQQYAHYGEIISDDNQLLTYGKVLYVTNLLEDNLNLLQRINKNFLIKN